MATLTETEKNFSANQRVFITSLISMDAFDETIIESVKEKYGIEVTKKMIDQFRTDEERVITRERKKIGMIAPATSESGSVISRASALLNKRLNRGISDQAELESLTKQYAKNEMTVEEFVRQKSMLLEIPTSELLKIIDTLTPKPQPILAPGKRANATDPEPEEATITMSDEQIKQLSDALASGDAIKIQAAVYDNKK